MECVCVRERGREVGQRRERRREREVFVRKREREACVRERYREGERGREREI